MYQPSPPARRCFATRRAWEGVAMCSTVIPSLSAMSWRYCGIRSCGTNEQHLVARTVAHSTQRVAGCAEGLTAALLPAQDESTAVARLGQSARQVLALEVLPRKRGVLAVGAAFRGDLVN